MKVNLNHKIKTLEGKDWKETEQDGIDEKGNPKFKESKSLDTRRVCASALSTIFQDERSLESIDRAKRGWLAMKIFNHPDPMMDLTSEEVTLCKDLIGKRYNPVIVAQAWEVLDPESKQ